MIILLLVLVVLGLAFPPVVHAAAWSGDCVAGDVATIQGIKCIITNLLSVIPPLIILVAAFVIVGAGAKIILGGENPKEYAAGMQTLMYAIVGILGLGLVWLVLVIIEKFTGAPVTILNIHL